MNLYIVLKFISKTVKINHLSFIMDLVKAWELVKTVPRLGSG